MIGRSTDQKQRDIFSPLLCDFIDMHRELVLLSQRIYWTYFEKEFRRYHFNVGLPSMLVRPMVDCLILKRMCHLGGETICEAWIRNPYMQYFCGETPFKHSFPSDPIDFLHFRKRTRELGVVKIFACPIKLCGKSAKDKMVLFDTTVRKRHRSTSFWQPLDGI